MTPPATDDAIISQLKAIGHPLRFRILELLKSGERNVGDIEAAAGIGQPALSQQLGVLRKAGLIERRKEAKLVFYSRDEDRLAQLADLIRSDTQIDTTSPGNQKSSSPGAANFARLP